MNLIRDGGFEKGNLTFWDSIGSGAVVISDTDPKFGTYCAQMTVPYDEYLTLRAVDYVPVLYGQIVVANYYAVTADCGTVYTRFYEYNSDLDLIKTTDRLGGDLNYSYKRFQAMLVPQPNTQYVRIGVCLYGNEDAAHVKLDECYVSLISGVDPLTCRLEIVNKVGVVSSYNTADEPHDMLGFETYYADIDCSVLGGTTPTLLVKVYEKDVYDNPVLLGTFPVLSAVGGARITLDQPVGDGMYVTYTEGGTWTGTSFAVTVTGVRS